MKTEAITTYSLTMDKVEAYNLVRVLIEYIDKFEEDSYEIDGFTQKNLEEILYAINDKNKTKEVMQRLEIIKRRCKGR